MDGLCLKSGIQGMPPPAISLAGAFDGRASMCHVSASGRSSVDRSKVVAAPPPPPQRTTPAASSSSSSSHSRPSRFSFRYPLKSLWFGGNGGGGNARRGIALDDAVLVENPEKTNGADVGVDGEAENSVGSDGENGNWVFKILHLRTGTKEGEQQQQQQQEHSDGEIVRVLEKGLVGDEEKECSPEEEELEGDGDDGEDWCDACRVDYDEKEKEIQIDRDTFSGFLHRVSLDQAKLYAKMAYLGNLAYAISEIKPANLLKTCGLRLVTSSVDERGLVAKAAEDQVSNEVQEESQQAKEMTENEKQKSSGYQLSASAAYHAAASAASYMHSHVKGILSSTPSDAESDQRLLGETMDGVDIMNSDMVNFMAATDSVTAVVAAEEEVKQALADDLKSKYSSPCEWFICDDDRSNTRFFVIQGSESLASWQANLLFEPIQFEGFDTLVHRGIYEAAKGMYEQMLPEVRAHLKAHGDQATFRFTGHSLGGSLSLLINLMLLLRGEVPASQLLPVITFGAPSIMCGGDRLLRKLGLPRSHVQAVTMHRDIVPRAFSCSYPNHVAELLKAINGNFRNHPCLNNEKLLYAPMGELLILQPDEKFSPRHDLLPSGSGLYLLSCLLTDFSEGQKQIRAAQKLFFDSPHPLEILSDRGAYGSGGTIQRDHDMNSYLKSVRVVIRQELNRIRKARRERRRKLWWPLVGSTDFNDGIVLDRTVRPINAGQHQFTFSGIIGTGQESIKRFSRLVASQRMHLFMVLLLPARLLLLGAYSVISFS
ncbi:hypothetical protein CDL15_Pgr010052 [Punica granatum]|uniref:Fungal lipase-type domain-containing protein n=1 Tax=Punica granatum TaxID=22663 RepID=A0A218X563_PUNGR|nr:hypothetical protein CDL15_Pgr010052 [Punica granatum]PKI70280.1 hypothetical protein CRG98_009309 [Punica granatum]